MRIDQQLDYYMVLLTNLFGVLFDTTHTIYETAAKRPLEYGIGNCHEFTMVALHYLRKIDRNLSAHPYYIQNGDHVFLIIGEAEDAVVCDAWAGEVYPACDIVSRMGNFKSYSSSSSYLNVVTTFNPKFHSIEQRSIPGYYQYTSFKLLAGIMIISLLFKTLNSIMGNVEVDLAQMAL